MLLSFGIVWIAAFMLKALWQHCMTDRFDLTPKVDLNGNIDLVSWEEWPKLRDTINRDAWNDTQGVQPFSFPPVLSCEDMIVRGTQCFLDHYKISFPTKFATGTGAFCSQKRKGAQGLSFWEYHQLSSHQLTRSPTMHATCVGGYFGWKASCFILGPILTCLLVVRKMSWNTVNVRRSLAKHQTRDWVIHRKYCKKATRPACPIKKFSGGTY